VSYDRKAVDSRAPRSIFWLLAFWVILLLAALVWGVDNAEATLGDSARRALAAGGHDIVVDFSGRDARLIGTVTSDSVAADIADSIDALPGVRDVDSEIVVADALAPTSVNPDIVVRLVGDVVSISGLVPDEEVEADLVEAAAEEFGATSIVNALVVSEDVQPQPWLGRIQDVFAHLGTLRSGGFAARSSGVLIDGEVISEAARDEIIEGITLVLDDLLPVSDNITIAVLPPPTFSASGRDGVVTLSGVLPDQETIDSISAAAERLHGNSEIDNEMQVGDVAGPMWIESIDGLLDVVTRLDPWAIRIDAGNVTITGLGLDEDLVAAVVVLTEEVVAGQLSVMTDVELDPAAVATQLTQLLEGNATFEPSGIELSGEGKALLDSALAILNANPSAVLVVEGHTDDQGDATENRNLSLRRAEVVVAYLVAGGIAPERLTAIGYGEDRPMADNSTEEGRAQNRRIEFVIQKGEG
jgi:OOP family OmpA-OmpF porin